MKRFISVLITEKWPLIPFSDILIDSDDEMEAFIEHLAIRSLNNFQHYNFTDILNAICGVYVKFIINSNPEELTKIKRESIEKFGKEANDIEDM